MCFIFTYLSMTIDFIQRLWTFLMTCCIGCTVFILLFIAAVAGVTFGYNYSVSEYYRVQDSQKLVILTRNLFANKTGDNKIHIRKNSTKENIKSGDNTNLSEDSKISRLTDNEIPNSYAFESEDQINYENSLSSPDPWDLEMDVIINKYPSGSVDQMKAILNHIYLRKSKKSLNKTSKTSATTCKPTELSTSESAFAANDANKLRYWQETNQNCENEQPTWRSVYLTLADVTERQSNNSTFSVAI